MCNLPCCLVLNWPGVDLLTFVYCLYYHRRSQDRSVFLSPDRVALDEMPHMRNCTIGFCTHHYRIDIVNLTNCCSATQIFVMVMPMRCSQQKAAFWYWLLTALRSRKCTLLNKSRKIFWENLSYRATDQILKLLRQFLLLLLHGYYLLKNIKSIRKLVMFQDNKWNSRSCFISKVGHSHLCKELKFSVTGK